MKPNIDKRGRFLRLVTGVALLLAGALILLLQWFGVLPGVAASVAALLCLALGLFAAYEAHTCWCALRALGIRTPV